MIYFHLVNLTTFLVYFGVSSTSDSPPMLAAVFSQPQGVDEVKFPAYSSMVEIQVINYDYYQTLFDQSQIGAPPDANSSLTVAQKQKFTIKTISPEWGYATETTKVCAFKAQLLACPIQ